MKIVSATVTVALGSVKKVVDILLASSYSLEVMDPPKLETVEAEDTSMDCKLLGVTFTDMAVAIVDIVVLDDEIDLEDMFKDGEMFEVIVVIDALDSSEAEIAVGVDKGVEIETMEVLDSPVVKVVASVDMRIELETVAVVVVIIEDVVESLVIDV